MIEVYLTKELGALKDEQYLGSAEQGDEALAIARKHIWNRTDYWRYLLYEDGIYVDFGSWSTFLFFKGATINDFFSPDKGRNS